MEKFKGIVASEGTIRGSAIKVHNKNDFYRVKNGDILVVKKSSPEWIVPLMHSDGIICEIGGRFSHLAIICREIGIPCITGINGIFEKLHDGSDVLIDGNSGEVICYDNEKE